MVPVLSFVATANAVSYIRAVPHFIDCDEKTLGIDPRKLADYLEQIGECRNGFCYNRKTGRRIAAVVPMHVFGHPVDMDQLLEVCKRYSLPVVEDAAESLGSYYKDRHCGTMGILGILSFNGNKTITTGGGGAILTNDINLGRLAHHLTTTAKLPHKWEYIHDEIGYNYRLPNINAALGCAQMEELHELLEKKRSIAHAYEKAFSDVSGVSFFHEPDGCKSNYWLNALVLDRADLKTRDGILEKTNASGFMTRPVWGLMHRQSMYVDCPRMDLSVAEDMEKRVINLPSGPGLDVKT
jgi:perosamine synthetase